MWEDPVSKKELEMLCTYPAPQNRSKTRLGMALLLRDLMEEEEILWSHE